MGQQKNNSGVRKKKSGSIRSIFIHADGIDYCLMVLGFLGSVGDGFGTPLVLLITSRLMNHIGTVSSPTSIQDLFLKNINKVIYFFYHIFFILFFPLFIFLIEILTIFLFWDLDRMQWRSCTWLVDHSLLVSLVGSSPYLIFFFSFFWLENIKD